MWANKLSVPLFTAATLSACYPAVQGGSSPFTPTVAQVATTRPEIVRMRYGSQWAAHDSVGSDSGVDSVAAGALIVWAILHPEWQTQVNGWPESHRSGMPQPMGPALDRLYYPLVRVVQPMPECTTVRPSALPGRVLAWCPLVRLSWSVSDQDW